MTAARTPRRRRPLRLASPLLLAALAMAACTGEPIPNVPAAAGAVPATPPSAAASAAPRDVAAEPRSDATPAVPSETTGDAPAAPPPPSRFASPVDVEIALSYEVSRDIGRPVIVDCPDDMDVAGPAQCSFSTDVHGTRPVFVGPGEGGGLQYETALDVPRLSTMLAAEVGRQVGQPVNIACPPVIEAEVGTSFVCTATQQDGTVRQVSGAVADPTGNVTLSIQ